MEHHTLDVFPVPNPKKRKPLFINEPWIIDKSLSDEYGCLEGGANPENQSDNIRIYVPIDLNREAILRRLRYIIDQYGDAGEYPIWLQEQLNNTPGNWVWPAIT